MRKEFKVGAIIVGLAITVALALASSTPESQAQTPAAEKTAAAVHAGRDIFVQNCMQCHSTNEGQVIFGPSLYAEMKKPQGKKTAAEIRVILTEGKGKMPPFKDKLTAEETDKLIAYLHTL